MDIIQKRIPWVRWLMQSTHELAHDGTGPGTNQLKMDHLIGSIMFTNSCQTTYKISCIASGPPTKIHQLIMNMKHHRMLGIAEQYKDVLLERAITDMWIHCVNFQIRISKSTYQVSISSKCL